MPPSHCRQCNGTQRRRRDRMVCGRKRPRKGAQVVAIIWYMQRRDCCCGYSYIASNPPPMTYLLAMLLPAAIVCCLCLLPTHAYSVESKRYFKRERLTSGSGCASISRRNWLGSSVVGVASWAMDMPDFGRSLVHAAAPKAPPIDPLTKIQDSQSAIDALLQNWKRATIDCTYADVPRDLLEAKNKELLLEKASTFALFDKSVSVETCKTTNRIVRDYLGVTNKGPLVQIMKTLQSTAALDRLADPDDLEEYLAAVEMFGQALANASSLSYAAGIADLNSVNNFSKEEANDTSSTSNLEQARAAIVDMKSNLDRIVVLLTKE